MDLREFLAGLGLDPVLSEFTSFPVNPDVSTLDNCLKAVEQRADVFVLIIGGRYGSVKRDGASITNLEFLRARAKGIPVYSFVERRLLDMLPVWRANPNGDFTPVVDTVKVFEFIAGIRESGGQWVFPFETAQEICATLRSQLSYLFKEALDVRHRVYGSDSIPGTLRHLSGEPMRLLIERPSHWEYLFFAESLRNEIERYSSVRRDWENGICFGDQELLSGRELIDWIPVKLDQVKRLWGNAANLLNDALQKAFRPPGTPGNAEEIYYVAAKLGETYRETLRWKLDFQRVSVDLNREKLKALVSCLCDNTVRELEEFSRSIKDRLRDAITEYQSTRQRVEVSLTLTLTAPDMTGLNEELERLRGLM